MLELHLPWLELTILTPLLGVVWLLRLREPEVARKRALIAMGITLICAVGAWEDFNTLHVFEAHDHWDVISKFVGSDVIVIDELSAPLLPLGALLYFLTTLATLRTKVRRVPFVWNLASLAMLMAMLSCRQPWVLIVLLGLQTIPPLIEIRSRGRSIRPFAIHMAVCVGLLAAGWALINTGGPSAQTSLLGVGMLTAGVLLRSGIVPVHCWMTDLFENATFSTALLFVTPMTGAYAAVRLVLPIAPDWALRAIAILSLITAVYAAGMALVQLEARRFFCYLFLSHSSLVLVGLEVATPIGLTGALCVWVSVGLALTGFGLTLRALEARTGRLSLTDYHGLYSHMPHLAAFFLITGMASIGFPGTIGFVGAELLVEGAVGVFPYVGILVVLAMTLNGIAVLLAYFRLFTGAKHTASISLQARPPEKAAVLVLAILIIGGGLIPQPGVRSRYHAAVEVIDRRDDSLTIEGEAAHPEVAQSDLEQSASSKPDQLVD